MSRSHELFEILGRKPRNPPPSEEPARAPDPRRKRKTTTAVSRPAGARRSAERAPARPARAAETAHSVGAEKKADGKKVVLSGSGAALLGILAVLLIALAYMAGASRGRLGELLSPVMSVTRGEGAASSIDGATTNGPPIDSSSPAGRKDDDQTWTVRAITYGFSRANNQRADEVRSYLASQGFRDVAVRVSADGKELRVYAGCYSRPDDPALLEMQKNLRAMRGDDKWGKYPFKTACIGPLPPAKRGD
jgi:hypothetical protein